MVNIYLTFSIFKEHVTISQCQKQYKTSDDNVRATYQVG